MLKLKNILATVAFASFASLMLTSCDNDEPSTDNLWITIDFNLEISDYTDQGYWVNVYNPQWKAFALHFGPKTIGFSHHAEVTEYEGVEYKSFTGFCPSIVDDQTDHSSEDWTLYQFASMANPQGFGYTIAHWDVRETEQTPLADRSCMIDFITTVQPVSMTVTNTAWTYWVMKNGSAFSRPFSTSDELILDIYAVKDKSASLAKSVYLAHNGQFVDDWETVDLSGLGEVEQIYFTMRSTDSGDWGMNTPAYFAIGSMQVVYVGSK